jgi:long-subunit acyl-CoA synthetase (AMP-forming)
VISYKEKMPELKEVVERLNKPIKLISISELIFFDETESFAFTNTVPCSMDDLAIIPFSSGTTSLPKAVGLTHRNIVSNLQQVSHRESIYATGKGKTWQYLFVIRSEKIICV